MKVFIHHKNLNVFGDNKYGQSGLVDSCNGDIPMKLTNIWITPDIHMISARTILPRLNEDNSPSLKKQKTK